MKYSDSVKTILLAAIDELAAPLKSMHKDLVRILPVTGNWDFGNSYLCSLPWKENASVRRYILILDDLQMHPLKLSITNRCRSLKPAH